MSIDSISQTNESRAQEISDERYSIPNLPKKSAVNLGLKRHSLIEVSIPFPFDEDDANDDQDEFEQIIKEKRTQLMITRRKSPEVTTTNDNGHKGLLGTK